MLVEPLARDGRVAGRDVFVAFSPERLDPGNANRLQHEVPRVVGGATAACATRASEVLRRICPEVHVVGSPETAEMTKLYENIFRAVNIALANEVSDIACALEIDPMEVIRAASTKPYGFMPFYPGPGVGGHCIPCDPHYLRWQLRALREESPLIDQAMELIACRPRRVFSRIREVLSDRGVSLAGARILIYGIAYKPQISDTRGSPAIEIMQRLLDRGAHVSYYDPLVTSVELGQQFATTLGSPEGEWDLVLAHTMHSNRDVDWLSARANVLDVTYRLPRVAGISVV
jgi:nucleotide sugar dehydrogenase